MALTPAEKQRRYRRHAKNDHSLCDPARGCSSPLPRPPAGPPPVTATLHGERGRALLAELGEAVRHDVMGQVLLEEAARTCDRLDLLRGSAEVDAMTEARQQVASLQRLLADVRKVAGVQPAGASGSQAPAAGHLERQEDVQRDDDFASRLAKRRAAAAG